MLEIYWGCLIGGVIFAVVAILLGDVIGHGDTPDVHLDVDHPDVDGGHLDVLKPAVIIGGIAAFGGAGILLTRYSTLAVGPVIATAVALAVVVGAAVWLLYIRPMRNAENSVGFSIRDLVGKMGEVMTTIPATGNGEVMIRIGGGVTCQIAASTDGEEIRAGADVVIVEVDRDTVYVTPVDPAPRLEPGR